MMNNSMFFLPLVFLISSEVSLATVYKNSYHRQETSELTHPWIAALTQKDFGDELGLKSHPLMREATSFGSGIATHIGQGIFLFPYHVLEKSFIDDFEWYSKGLSKKEKVKLKQRLLIKSHGQIYLKAGKNEHLSKLLYCEESLDLCIFQLLSPKAVQDYPKHYSLFNGLPPLDEKIKLQNLMVEYGFDGNKKKAFLSKGRGLLFYWEKASVILPYGPVIATLIPGRRGISNSPLFMENDPGTLLIWFNLSGICGRYESEECQFTRLDIYNRYLENKDSLDLYVGSDTPRTLPINVQRQTLDVINYLNYGIPARKIVRSILRSKFWDLFCLEENRLFACRRWKFN